MKARFAAAALAAVTALAGAGCAAGTGGAASGATDAVASCGPSTVRVPDKDVEPLSPAPKPELPVTVASADGKRVTVKKADRVLALNLYGSLAEIVFSLGLGDRVIGRDASTTFPSAAKLPLVTNQGHDLSAEAILRMDPDVVLADRSIGPPEALQQIRAAGIPVVMVDDRQTIPAIGEHITAIAAALGVPAAGKKLNARVTAQIDAARAKASHGGEPLRVAFLYLRGTAGVYLIGGKGAGSDAMIQAVGATDAGTAAGLSGFRPLTSEGLINAAPDVILVMTDGLESVGGVKGLLKLPGVAQTPAGRAHRVVDADDGTLLNFGARTGETIEALAVALHDPCGAR
ncbi:heme/hemin ABC transporter substrate-binding protein [Actinomadura atramentaria]|uniref:heme/hemin ABC transporter substrate-binding protein n=1 Tax=Actinomadura atramentaria TaxID=1990 RepID=UPI0003775910|nr:ABC transporter substrate-binding protein [Actinomadura atramentaria]